MKRKLIVFLCSTMACCVSSADKGIPLTIRDAVMLSLRYSATVQNAEVDRVTQKFSLAVAEYQFQNHYTLDAAGTVTWNENAGVTEKPTRRLAVTPIISRKLSYGGTIVAGAPITYDGTNLHPQATIAVTQPVLRGFGPDITLAPLNTAKDNEESFKLGMKGNIIGVVTTVITDYLQVVRATSDLQVQTSAIVDQQTIIKQNTARIRVGQLPRTINIEANAQLASLRLSQEQAKDTLRRTRYQLLEDIGLDPELPIVIPATIDVGALTVPEVSRALGTAFQSNIPYNQALIQLKIDQRSLRVAKDDQRWALSLAAGATVGATAGRGLDSGFGSLFNGRNQSQTIGFTLSVPINDMTRQQTLVNAQVQVDKDKITLADLERQLIIQVRNAVADIESQVRQIQLSKQSVKLAYDSYVLEQKKQALGLSSSLDVTQSQNSYISAQVLLAANLASYRNATAQLQQILGITLDKWKIRLKY